MIICGEDLWICYLVVSSWPGCHLHRVHDFFHVHHLKNGKGIPDSQPDIAYSCEMDIIVGVQRHPSKDTYGNTKRSTAILRRAHRVIQFISWIWTKCEFAYFQLLIGKSAIGIHAAGTWEYCVLFLYFGCSEFQRSYTAFLLCSRSLIPHQSAF